MRTRIAQLVEIDSNQIAALLTFAALFCKRIGYGADVFMNARSGEESARNG